MKPQDPVTVRAALRVEIARALKAGNSLRLHGVIAAETLVERAKRLQNVNPSTGRRHNRPRPAGAKLARKAADHKIGIIN